MNRVCIPSGYNKATYPSGKKVYFPVVDFLGVRRVTRKRFGRAQAAFDYAELLARRANRLLESVNTNE